MELRWHRLDLEPMEDNTVTKVVVDRRALAITKMPGGYGALDNRCPHQGGPLGEGIIEGDWLLCPWHGYEYNPLDGEPPEGYGDVATCFAVEERDDGLYVQLPVLEDETTLMDQMVDVMTSWGVDTVFGMVGHSNLGLADALRKAEADGRLTYYGIRHEGAASFAASAFGKLTGRPAACFSIAGPGATNLLTGLWDAKRDRAPILALTGQVDTQVLGPGAFQEIPTAAAFEAVSEWSQTVLVRENATELMALAIKHAVVNRDVAHLIFPDDMQTVAGLEAPAEKPIAGRLAATPIAPPESELQRAVDLIERAERPVIIVGHGARPYRTELVALAEHIDAPVITTFKAKGLIGDSHPLGCGVLGRSGTRVGSAIMGRADLLIVFGASFSNHTGISKNKTTIQVDFDRMMLGKFHAVDVPLWGEIGRTVAAMMSRLGRVDRPEVREEIAARWEDWRAEKRRRITLRDDLGRLHPAVVFEVLHAVVPADAVLTVDVGNNAYAFGQYFESSGRQDVLMSGYLGSIGFALPAALGAFAAVGRSRPIVSVSGDGGLAQYLAEFTTAVLYDMPITHVVLNNDELGKISREQVGGLWPVWQTALVNPDFAAFAELCGGRGFTAGEPEELERALSEALAHDGPAMVEVAVTAQDV